MIASEVGDSAEVVTERQLTESGIKKYEWEIE